ncbi:MAG: hypothetical protein QM703_26805 [Gemmatales bacterium]
MSTGFRWIFSLVGVWLLILSSVPLTSGQESKTPAPPLQQSVNYADPPREYETTHAGKWLVQVEKQLAVDAPHLSAKVLNRLEKKLGEALKVLPVSSQARLKKLDIYVMYGPKAKGGGRDNGLEYFQKGDSQAP